MIESYLEDGRQNEPEVFGKSITDPCPWMGNTEALVREIYQTTRRIRWHLLKKGQEIDIEAIKAKPNLSAEALQLKERRDRMADIISGEDDRILLVIGPCSSDNEEAVLGICSPFIRLAEESGG